MKSFCEFFARRETLAYAVLSVAFLAANLVTSDRSPPVWLDEVYLLDPAANLADGRGFFGSFDLLEGQDQGMWVGYAPLYSWLLSGWLRWSGFGITEARSLNYFLAVAAGCLLVGAARCARLLTTAWLRVGLFGTWLCAYGVAFCYRCGRVDVLLMVFIGALALLWAGRRDLLSMVSIFLIAAASPWAGLQLCVLIAILATMALCISRGALWRPWLWTGLGGVGGAAGFWAEYRAAGVWDAFWLNTSGHLNKYFLGSNGFHDLSLQALVGVAIITLAWSAYRRAWSSACAAGIGLVFGSVVALGIMLIGHFPIYYSWMAFLPVWLGWGTAIDQLCREGNSRPVGWFALVAMCVVAGLGLPARLARTVKEWHARDYAHVRRLVEAHILPGDVVAADYPVYYAVRPLAGGMIVGKEMFRAKPETLERLDAVVIPPSYASVMLPKLGPGWQEVGRTDPSAVSQYQLRVYRRTSRAPYPPRLQ